jgi:hypothetical protein
VILSLELFCAFCIVTSALALTVATWTLNALWFKIAATTLTMSVLALVVLALKTTGG